MRIKTIFGAIGILAGLTLASGVAAAPFDASDEVCSAGTSEFIAVGDVTSSSKDALDCFGVFDGNDPGPSGDGIDTDGDGTADFNFLSKYENGTTTGANLGFAFNNATKTWTFTPTQTFAGSWLFLIKQGGCWAAWEFGGGAHSSGTYQVTFGTQANACIEVSPTGIFSHVSVYGERGQTVPEPGSLALLGLGLVGLGLARRRKAVA